MLVGYARVSTEDQDLTLQRTALSGAGCKRIYEEKVSGAKRSRPELDRMLDQLRAGDVIVVSRLDRLARSTRDLLDIAEQLKEVGAGLRSLHEPWADTTSPAGRMVLTVFAGIAEFERALINERTSTGRVAPDAGMCDSHPDFAATDHERRSCRPDQGRERMDAIAIFVLLFMIGWFAAIGAHRAGAIMSPLWALLGAFIWTVGFYVFTFITEQLLGLAGTTIAANGVVVLSKIVGICAGIGLCYLFYRLVVEREPAVTFTPSTSDTPSIPGRTP